MLSRQGPVSVFDPYAIVRLLWSADSLASAAVPTTPLERTLHDHR